MEMKQSYLSIYLSIYKKMQYYMFCFALDVVDEVCDVVILCNEDVVKHRLFFRSKYSKGTLD